MKILPSEVGVDLEGLVEALRHNLPEGVEVRGWREEPIAFGLVALILDVVAEEREEVVEKIERAVRSTESVGQMEVLGMSRLSTRL